jgi:hypothetical protein
MMRDTAVAVATILLVIVFVPALLFVASMAVQEGCLICFQGGDRGGLLEATLNVSIAAVLAWAGYKLFRRFVMP